MSVWPPNASFYASSTCVRLRLLAGPFDLGFMAGVPDAGQNLSSSSPVLTDTFTKSLWMKI